MENQSTSAPPDYIRYAVRDFLTRIPGWREMDPEGRRSAAELMVRVCRTATALVAEELESEAQVERLRGAESAPPAPVAAAMAAPSRTARALSAGSEFSGVSAQRVAGTTRDILNAVSFPTFVADLINGVFKAMSDNNARQMQMFVELLNNVSASTEGFADMNMGPDRAREWLVEHFPASFQMEGGSEEESGGDSWGNSGGWSSSDEPANEARVRLLPGASMPTEEALRTALGMEPNESVPTGDPDRSLVPLVRRRLARLRQETLATMVQLGLQRIVIDGGRIHASMRFHIDTRSAAQAEAGSMFSMQNRIKAKGKVGMGIWGVSAEAENNISYVSSQRSTSSEEMNTDLELNSSVELIFRTDQVPLDRLANARQTTQILANSRNPAEEMRIAADERRQRLQQQLTSEGTRAGKLADVLRPPPPAPAEAPPPAPARPPTGGTTAPPAGGTTAPPAGRTTAPPAGGTTAPPTGGTTAPPAGGTTAPPAGRTTAPPAGGTTAPPTGGTTAPPAGRTPAPPAGGTPAPPAGETPAPPAGGASRRQPANVG